MYFKLNPWQETELISKPETGMGYQVIEARKTGSYSNEHFIVLNSEIVIEMNREQDQLIRRIFAEGLMSSRSLMNSISFSSVRVLNKIEFKNLLHESGSGPEKGAKDNPKENADGDELFVRLSAFDDDKRVDKVTKRLRPGSYTTTLADYLTCKKIQDDPVERYALPSNDAITWAFHIQPKKVDILQRGTVQPANGKRGGGKEAYFENGTSPNTFLKQTPY